MLLRTFFRAVSIGLFAVGAFVVAISAIREWQSSHDLLLVGVVLGTGLGLSGLLAWAVRAVSLGVAIGLFAAGWYLLLYGWMGPEFIGTAVGIATWVAATALSALTAVRVRWRGMALAARLAAGVSGL